MRLQKRGDAFTQLARAVAVNDAHFLKIGDERVVEKTRHAIDGLIDGHADHVQLAQHAFARLQIDVDADLRGRLSVEGGPPITRSSFDLRLHALAAHVDFGAVAVDRDHDAFEPESANRHLRADFGV